MAVTSEEIQEGGMLGEGHLILVLLGSSSWRFDRLVNEMDRIASMLHEEVVIQTGEVKYDLSAAASFSFVSNEEIEAFLREARIIVSHAVAGTIIRALKLRKRIVVVPRIGGIEHCDNHQIELARAFESEGKVRVVYDIGELASVIQSVDTAESAPVIENETELVSALRRYLESVELSRTTSSCHTAS